MKTNKICNYLLRHCFAKNVRNDGCAVTKSLQFNLILLTLLMPFLPAIAGVAAPEAHCEISKITNLEMVATDLAAKNYSGMATFSVSCTPGALVTISLRSTNRTSEYRNIVSPMTGLITKYILGLTPDCNKAWGEIAYGESVYQTVFTPGMADISVAIYGKTVGEVKSARAEQLLDNVVINVEAS